MAYTFLLDTDSELFHTINDEYNIIPYEDVDNWILLDTQVACSNITQAFPNYCDVKVLFFNDDIQYSGVFISGTASSTPVILINLNSMRFYDQITFVHTTVYHEFGHALFELDRDVYGGEYLNNKCAISGTRVPEEVYVEGFAISFFEYRTIFPEIKTLLENLD